MPVIAVVNGKGGSGKSTVAAHLAAWCAHRGEPVMLSDVDRQQSARTWLRERDAALPAIAHWAAPQTSALRAPNGIAHLIVDTPGSLHGFDLARVVMHADAIVMPVGNSIFDREAAAACHAELRSHPRVASGRCRLAGIGMRIDARPQASAVLQDWAEQQGFPLLGVLRENSLYVECIEQGMTLFDLPSEEADVDRAQWQPLLDWLSTILDATQPTPMNTATPARRPVTHVRPASHAAPVREPLLSSDRPSLVRSDRKAASPFVASRAAVTTRPASLETFQHIPAFLRQVS